MKWAKLFKGKRRSPEPTRRELVQQRRAAAEQAGAGKGGAIDRVSAQAYTRNRTLSAHHERPAEQPSERKQMHALRAHRRKLMRWLAGSVGALAVVIVLMFQFVGELRVETPGKIAPNETARYTEVMRDYLAKRPLERLRFWTDEAALYEYFLEHASEVQSVKIASGGLGVGTLQISFRQPVVSWSASGKTFFVDAQGVTFEKNYFDAPGVNVEDQSGVSPEMGQEIINHQFLSFLGQAVALFKEQGVTIQRVVLPDGTVRQAEFFAEQVPYSIKMTVERSAAAQVGQAVYAIRAMGERGVQPVYIDVRVDQRVFYK